jgi:hypothetical protein
MDFMELANQYVSPQAQLDVRNVSVLIFATLAC